MKNIKLYITTKGSYPERDHGYGMDLVITTSLKEKNYDRVYTYSRWTNHSGTTWMEDLMDRNPIIEERRYRKWIQKVNGMENKTINIWLKFDTTVIRDTYNNPIYDVCDLSVTSVISYLIVEKETVCGYKQRKVRGSNKGLWMPLKRSVTNPLLVLKWIKRLFSQET